MAAKKKEVTTLTLAEIGVETDEVGVANAGSKVTRVDSEAAEDRGREGHRRGRRRHQGRRVPGCSKDHLADHSDFFPKAEKTQKDIEDKWLKYLCSSSTPMVR